MHNAAYMNQFTSNIVTLIMAKLTHTVYVSDQVPMIRTFLGSILKEL